MFNFRLINTADGNQIIDTTLKTPYSSLTPIQMVEYMEMDSRLLFMDRMKKQRDSAAEHRRNSAKNPLYKIACIIGIL